MDLKITYNWLLDYLETDAGPYEIQKYPGFFAVGEMLSWDAPTGGFLIQACVSQGFTAGKQIAQT